MTTPTGEAPKRRGERTDNSVKKLPNGKGWRARPTLGTDPVTGKQVRPTKVFATKKPLRIGSPSSAASGVRRHGHPSPRARSMRSPITG
jgi:hypothetical protein